MTRSDIIFSWVEMKLKKFWFNGINFLWGLMMLVRLHSKYFNYKSMSDTLSCLSSNRHNFWVNKYFIFLIIIIFLAKFDKMSHEYYAVAGSMDMSFDSDIPNYLDN